MIDERVSIGSVVWKNAVTTASGTFGSGREYGSFFDLSALGAITVKGVSPDPWMGNPPSRIAETYGGMLNAVGLQNPGIPWFLEQDLPFLRQYDTNIIVNLCGHTVEEYCRGAEMLSQANIDMIELNISCPNVSEGCITFGVNPDMAEKVVAAVKKVCAKPLIVKLSPNVTDITEIAKSVEAGGADCISLINTVQGMKIDIRRKKAVLANKIGGLSGPAIRPIGVRMVYQVRHAVSVPIIGMGGITNGADAIEYIMAGATAVAVGTAHFSDPFASLRVVQEIKTYMEENSVNNLSEICGII